MDRRAALGAALGAAVFHVLQLFLPEELATGVAWCTTCRWTRRRHWNPPRENLPRGEPLESYPWGEPSGGEPLESYPEGFCGSLQSLTPRVYAGTFRVLPRGFRVILFTVVLHLVDLAWLVLGSEGRWKPLALLRLLKGSSQARKARTRCALEFRV